MKLSNTLALPDISKIPDGPVKDYLQKLHTALENQHRLIHNDINVAPVVITFIDSDATPSVKWGNLFLTNTTGLTITRFDDGVAGQMITIISKGAIVFDTSPATRLIGSSVDITTASGDVTVWVCETGGTTTSVWRLMGFVDVSVDNSAGA